MRAPLEDPPFYRPQHSILGEQDEGHKDQQPEMQFDQEEIVEGIVEFSSKPVLSRTEDFRHHDDLPSQGMGVAQGAEGVWSEEGHEEIPDMTQRPHAIDFGDVIQLVIGAPQPVEQAHGNEREGNEADDRHVSDLVSFEYGQSHDRGDGARRTQRETDVDRQELMRHRAAVYRKGRGHTQEDAPAQPHEDALKRNPHVKPGLGVAKKLGQGPGDLQGIGDELGMAEAKPPYRDQQQDCTYRPE